MQVAQFGDLLGNSQKLSQHILKVFLSCLALAGIAFYFFDQPVSAFFAREEVRSQIWQTSRFLTDFGLSEYYFVGALLTWALAKWVAPRMGALQNAGGYIEFARKWGLNFFVALIVSGILTHLVKFTFGRQRPHKTPDFDPYIFAPLNTHWHWQSFSSGHSQVMFTAATMMSVAFPRFRWFWIPFAALICLTRVIVHDHFLSDIIMGGCVGYIGSLLAMKIMRDKTANGLFLDPQVSTATTEASR